MIGKGIDAKNAPNFPGQGHQFSSRETQKLKNKGGQSNKA
jgi:hypothetical protein